MTHTGAPRQRRPGRPPSASITRPTRERVLEEATRLFAERGPDAVSMRSIAEAVGLDVSSVHHHFPTKAGLYDACFARVFEAERTWLEPTVERLAAAATGDDPAAFLDCLHELVDVFVAFLEERPETTYLWLRRWLDPAGRTSLDSAYSLPIYLRVEDALVDAAAHGLVTEPTPHVTVRGLVWAVHGHVTALAAHPAAAARESEDFRVYAHRLVDRLYGG